MKSGSYKRLCSSPDAFTRLELEHTLVALNKTDSAKKMLIEEALQAKAIKKPESHTGGKETDYIPVNIGAGDAHEIIEELGTLEAEAVSPEGQATPLASHYADLLDRWLHYSESLKISRGQNT